MAKTLAERLESLSGYRHAYPPHDPRASSNPVNYSHLLITVGGQLYHVLSRICDAGLDYSKRSNKLAHHVALEPPEIMDAVGGPAWVLSDESFCVRAWDGNVGHFSAGRRPKPGDRRPQRCDCWGALVGDPGWAGVLAESGLEDRGRPMPVIFKPGTDTLPLVVEALSLLPPERRWQVTFSTYFTKLPAGVDCRWRFLLDGSTEAKFARRDPHSPVIDLCKPLGRATGGPLVEAARTGKVVRPTRPKPALPKGAAVVASTPAAPMPAASVQPPSGAYDIRSTPPAHSGLQKAALADRLSRSTASYDYLRPRRRLSEHLKTAGFVLVLLLLLALVFVLGGQFFTSRLRQQEPVAAGSGNETKPEESTREEQPAAGASAQSQDTANPADASRKKRPPPDVDTRPPTNPNLEAARKKPNDGAEREDNAGTENAVSNDGANADSQSPKPAENPPQKPEPQPPKKQDPFEDIIKKHKRVLPLPELNRAGGGSSEPQELAKLFVPPGVDCRLSVLGSDKVLDKGRSFQVNRKDAHGTRTWTVIQKVKNVPVTQDIGSFTLTDDSLKFQWDENAKYVTLAPKLQYCVLDIRVGEQSERCTLTKPKEVESAKLELFSKQPRVDLDLAPDTVPNLELLRLELQPQGFPKHNQHQALAFETFLNIRKKIEGFEQTGRQRLTRGVLDNHRKVWTEEKVAGLKAKLDKIQGRIQEIERIAQQHREDAATMKAEIHRRAPREGAPQSTVEDHKRFVRETSDKIQQWSSEDAVRHTEMLDLQETELPPVKEAFDKADGQLRWRQAVEKLVDELANKGDLQYRVYVEIEGQKVGLIQSRGFSQD